MVYSPIQQLVDANPGEGTLLMPVAADSQNYDIKSDTPAQKQIPLSLQVRGFIYNVEQTGQKVTGNAKWTMTEKPFVAPNEAYTVVETESAFQIYNGALLIGTIQAGKTKLRVRSIEYLIQKVRSRVFLGRVDGFTFELQA